MRGWKKATLVLLVLGTCVGCDQVTKNVARETLRFAPAVTLLNGSVQLLYTENPGVAFSLGAALPEHLRWLLVTVGVGLVLLGVGLYVLRRQATSKAMLVGAGLIVGGGLGNLLDRLFNAGRVVDFMLIQVGPVSTAIFNVADVCIIAGMVLLVYSLSRAQAPSAAPPVPDA